MVTWAKLSHIKNIKNINLLSCLKSLDQSSHTVLVLG